MRASRLGRNPRLLSTWRLLTGALTVITATSLSFLLAGPLGLVVSVDVLAVAALGLALAAAPPAPRDRGLLPPRQSPEREPARWAHLPVWARLPPGRAGQRRPAADAAGFPAYRQISTDLTLAMASRRHYDYRTRRRLAKLLHSELADRPRVAHGQQEARQQVGEDVWPLLDLSQPPCEDSRAPGVGLATLARIVDRLERL